MGCSKSSPRFVKRRRPVHCDQSTDNLVYLTFKEGTISLENQEELTTNVDGDEGAALPITLEILPKHLTVYCGEEQTK